jgi:guanylate kinase
MEHSPKYIILSAPSGAGKTTIAKYLLKAGLGLEFSITACSRAKREGERDGIDYYYLTKDEFTRRVHANEFLEWEEVYPEHFYGTLKSEIHRIQKNGNRVLFDVDVVGGLNIKKIFKQNALAIFISPPSVDALKERLEKRSTDSADKIMIRINKAEMEMARAPEFDVIIINNQLENALKQTENVVKEFLHER